MCVGIPMCLLAIDGIAGKAEQAEGPVMIDLSLVPEAAVGDWVLNFLGTAHAILPEDEAQKILTALGALSSLMQGGSIGDAFADLDARQPELPPHLRAAQNAGLSQG